MLDADGNEITDSYHIGRLNPYRYRGYYFDEETGLYYLQSRYYDPETGRFLNADTVEYLDPETINGLNLYAYCGNNPVMYSDPSGHFPWLVFAIIAGILILGGGAIGGISAGMAGGSVGEVFAGIGKGTINGLVLSAGVLLTALGFYVGVTSIAGSALAFYGISVTANMLEVGVTQGKKSYYDGDDAWNTINDVNRSMFVNADTILGGELDLFSAFSLEGTRIIPKVFTGGKAYFSYLKTSFTKHYHVLFLPTMKKLLFAKSNPVFWFLGAGMTLVQVGKLMQAIFTTPNFEESDWILY